MTIYLAKIFPKTLQLWPLVYLNKKKIAVQCMRVSCVTKFDNNLLTVFFNSLSTDYQAWLRLDPLVVRVLVLSPCFLSGSWNDSFFRQNCFAFASTGFFDNQSKLSTSTCMVAWGQGRGWIAFWVIKYGGQRSSIPAQINKFPCHWSMARSWQSSCKSPTESSCCCLWK